MDQLDFDCVSIITSVLTFTDADTSMVSHIHVMDNIDVPRAALGERMQASVCLTVIGKGDFDVTLSWDAPGGGSVSADAGVQQVQLGEGVHRLSFRSVRLPPQPGRYFLRCEWREVAAPCSCGAGKACGPWAKASARCPLTISLQGEPPTDG